MGLPLPRSARCPPGWILGTGMHIAVPVRTAHGSRSAGSPSSLEHEFTRHVGDRRNRSGAPPSPAPGSTSGPEGQSKAEVRHAFVDQRSPKVKGVPGTAEGQWSCHVAVPRPLKRAAAHQLPRRSVASGLTSNFSLASWRRPHPRETGGASMRVPWWLAGCMAAALVLGGCSSTAKSGSPSTTTAVRSTTTTAAAPKPTSPPTSAGRSTKSVPQTATSVPPSTTTPATASTTTSSAAPTSTTAPCDPSPAQSACVTAGELCEYPASLWGTTITGPAGTLTCKEDTKWYWSST